MLFLQILVVVSNITNILAKFSFFFIKFINYVVTALFMDKFHIHIVFTIMYILGLNWSFYAPTVMRKSWFTTIIMIYIAPFTLCVI
jgi:hypothetical protein